MSQDRHNAAIDIKGISLRFGGVQALNDVSLEIREGEILSIIGPNGAGKTSFFNCINGFYHPYQGEILYRQKDLTRLKPHKIASLGIARTFQNIELFSGLSALDNLMAARHIHMRRGALSGCLFFGLTRKEEIVNREKIEEIIDLLEMESIRKKVVGSLPYGERKKVDMARALCMDPKVFFWMNPWQV
jgi:branched-chain amino acid transport system ATP-binding protein